MRAGDKMFLLWKSQTLNQQKAFQHEDEQAWCLLLLVSKDGSEWMTEGLDSHLHPPWSKTEDAPIQLCYVKGK